MEKIDREKKDVVEQLLDWSDGIVDFLNHHCLKMDCARSKSAKSKSKTYEFCMDCDNCGGGIEVDIPWGVTIDDFKATHHGLCPECGCSMRDNPS